MIKRILAKETCKQCKFCCSFRKMSLWEVPLFSEEQKKNLEQNYQNILFKEVEEKVFTLNLYPFYKENTMQEEASCFFLDCQKGCILKEEEKPFDCKIWPFRLMKKGESLVIALTPTCPAINSLNLDELKIFVREELATLIFEYGKNNPFIIKEYREDFPIILHENTR